MPFAATWMYLEIIIRSEASQRKIPYDVTYMWNLKYDTNELIYETETDSQRTDLRLPRGRRGGGGMDWEFGIDMYTLICIQWITNKNLLYKKLT